ncbi:hypothetical protein F442_04605 [Phytophthora nicotianae P10297]|uniref:RxLR effector protein n=2 Tax=Phytophthora nicotianae TaxID=4792 RepID=W2ZRP5_PHYNI|nr:hypothetical protein L915_04432 [Phytophthora nicotianae]ETL45531.1 hypothetical protein L916_04402 [Phytophthora nicotianae]ETL98721.1 hypothetical protein L917_04270 [Phytophthora nicotianae]ETM51882.1 hypothetical protein L914_04376 [Phytophthora nicotianae]ETP49968.1 hypothetical protein F442_04605 [Phytophthora nicotianae P10297]
MVRLLAVASLLVVALMSFAQADDPILDPMLVANRATDIAMDTSSAAFDKVAEAAKRSTNDKSQIIQKKA